MQQITDIKTVKASTVIRSDNGDLVCLHYDSEIFRANNETVLNLYVPSVTSSKMAKRCYEYVFGKSPNLKEWKILKDKFDKIRSIENA